MTFTPILWSTLRESSTAAALRASAETATEEQLILFHQRLDDTADELADECRIARPLADWLVTQGKQSWRSARSGEGVPAELPPEAWSARAVIEEVYRARFGRPIPVMEPPPVGANVYDPAWEEPFWRVMTSVRVGVPFEEAVGRYTRSELERLNAVNSHVIERALELANERWGDDSLFPYWAAWMPQLGKEVYDALVAGTLERPTDVPEGAIVVGELLDDEYQRRYQVGLEP